MEEPLRRERRALRGRHSLQMASGLGGEPNKPAGEDQIERMGKVVEQKDAMADGR
jgi:hypothetical protein